MQVSEKTDLPILRKLRTDGRADGQTLFYRILPVEAEGPINT